MVSAHRQFIQRRVDSFELNNFEDVKRLRQEEMFSSKKTTLATIYEEKERHLNSKRMPPEKRHYSRLTPKYHTTELKSPFIPYAAPAPCSLASRNSSHVSHEDTGFPTPLKSDFLISHPSSPKIERSKKDDYIDCHNKLEETEMFQPLSQNTEKEKLYSTGNICNEKNSHSFNVTMENINDYPLPSPATNKITIECLNKSDPKSFLTDLQILEEIISEDKREPVKASPDKTMNIQHPSPHYTRKMEEKIDCHRITRNAGEIEEKISDVWKNFITTPKQKNAETLTNEDGKQVVQVEKLDSHFSQDSPHKNDENGPIAANITNECCSPRRSKIAAEELKEVLAVQQYQSSQESLYYSSWSSTASENEVNEKTSTTEKLASSEVMKSDQKDTSEVPISSQDLPSTSTLKHLQNNIQKQIYTLGVTDGLKHLSKSKDIPVGNTDQEESNLTVFRIYPLNKSKEKSTQTFLVDSTKPTVIHKAIQCEIWTSNTLNYPEGNSCEDKISITNATVDSNDSGHPNTNTREHTLKSVMGSFVDEDMEKQTILECCIGSPDSESLPDKTGLSIKSSSILKLDVVSLNDPETGEEDPQQNDVGETHSHTAQNKSEDTVSQRNILERDSEVTSTDGESIVGIGKSTPPLLEISTNSVNDTTTSNNPEINGGIERKNCDQHLQHASPGKNVSEVSKVSPKISPFAIQNNHITLECNDNVVIDSRTEKTTISLENITEKNDTIDSKVRPRENEDTTPYDLPKNMESCKNLHSKDTAIINENSSYSTLQERR
ncbi:uncharacterized protein LOC114521744 [Dendronephthya gigantea]|uniref:uncharacterized protein LOC114521744 n=1 Tax=Dendronephthya gigantea TaxID=151771 RepID=UPI00106B4AF0|nr:uncharacterized protein LOC114521744 [Dendronephthya gigantea]